MRNAPQPGSALLGAGGSVKAPSLPPPELSGGRSEYTFMWTFYVRVHKGGVVHATWHATTLEVTGKYIRRESYWTLVLIYFLS